MTDLARSDAQPWTGPGRSAGVTSSYWSPEMVATAVALTGLGLQVPLGGKSVLFFLAGVAVLVIRSPEASFLAASRWMPAFTIALFALASTLWSHDPVWSLRLSFMLLITLISTVIMADRLTPSQFVGAYWVGMMVVVVGSAGSNNYTATEGGPGLAGLTGSKNALGYCTALGATTSLAMLLDRRQPAYLRWAGLVCVPLSLWVLMRTKSAGAMVSAGMGLGLLGGLSLLYSLTPRGRILALLAALLIAIPTVINFHAVTDTVQNFQEDVLKKDRTLTGRTYLWERAEPIIRTRPILGMGYAAFWRQGQLDAEGLWRHSGISNRSGFNFHNEYVDTAVTLGWTGVVILVVTLIGLCVPVFVRAMIDPTIPVIFFAANIAPMLLRTTAETGLISYWSGFTVLLYAGAVYARRQTDSTRSEAPIQAEPALADAPAATAGSQTS